MNELMHAVCCWYFTCSKAQYLEVPISLSGASCIVPDAECQGVNLNLEFIELPIILGISSSIASNAL
jgi:hypothetical protein